MFWDDLMSITNGSRVGWHRLSYPIEDSAPQKETLLFFLNISINGFVFVKYFD